MVSMSITAIFNKIELKKKERIEINAGNNSCGRHGKAS